MIKPVPAVAPAEVALNFAPQEVIIRDMLTSDRAIDDYLGDCARRRLTKRTRTTYARTLNEFDARLPRGLDVSKIERVDVERYLATKARLARGTVSGIETHLWTWFEWLREQRKITRNPMYGMARTKRLAAEDLDVVTVDSSDVLQLLELARPGTERNAIAILVYLGPRRHAASSLRLRDYNRKTREIRFREKGEKVIWKPIPEELRQVLEASVSRGEIRPAPEDYLIPPEGYLQRPGDRDDRVIWRVVKRVAGRAGIEAHVHALRAAFAVFYLEQFPGDMYGLQNLMGHRTPKTTETYLRRYDKRGAMQGVRQLSWAGASGGNEDATTIPQIAAMWLESSPVVGAGGFEPPFVVAPDEQRADSQHHGLEPLSDRLKQARRAADRSSRQ